MHVGLIVDGVRRWARREGMDLTAAYRHALAGVDDLIRNLFDAGVDAVSVYMLSRDNLKRTEHDLTAVFTASAIYLSSEMRKLSQEYDVRFSLAGDKTAIPAPYRVAIENLVSSSDPLASKCVYLLVAYSPAEELDACWEPGLTTMDVLIPKLWVPERVDLVIRTGGAALLSDFLPLQSGYARIWWTSASIAELTWDDIREEVALTLSTEALRGR